MLISAESSRAEIPPPKRAVDLPNIISEVELAAVDLPPVINAVQGKRPPPFYNGHAWPY